VCVCVCVYVYVYIYIYIFLRWGVLNDTRGTDMWEGPPGHVPSHTLFMALRLQNESQMTRPNTTFSHACCGGFDGEKWFELWCRYNEGFNFHF
jgi:hypothetical protein